MAKKLLFIINPRAGVQKISKPLLDIIQIFSDAGYLATALTTKSDVAAYVDDITVLVDRRVPSALRNAHNARHNS